MSNPVHQQIQSTVDANDVVLFMKGTPMFPQCGFSAAVVQVLRLMAQESGEPSGAAR